jgi:hypothetical protein
MSPTGLCVEHFVPSWWCCLGDCGNFMRWSLPGGRRSLGMCL